MQQQCVAMVVLSSCITNNSCSIGTLPEAPTFVGFVYWLPKVPASGGDRDLGSSDARLDLMRQLLRSR
jgi:hypothetical protein